MDEGHLLKILEAVAAGFRHLSDLPQSSGLWGIARTLSQDVQALRDMISPPPETPPEPEPDPAPAGDSTPSDGVSSVDPNAPQSEGGQQPVQLDPAALDEIESKADEKAEEYAKEQAKSDA